LIFLLSLVRAAARSGLSALARKWRKPRHYHPPRLSDIERVLVVSDGTFTYQLETFVREPIGVEILSNQLAQLSSNNAHLLQCRERSLAWDRRTLLRGEQTGMAYCYAASVINDEDLDTDFRAELRVTQSGIGHPPAQAIEES
jgi:chorismate-pyruvate lyase